MKSSLSINDRFWSKVDKQPSSCWLWKAGKDKNGYGVFHVNNKQIRAHRFVWQITHGEIEQQKFICHTCDTPACCNPSHLFIGTHDDNVADKVAKGRQASGDHCGSRLYPERRPRGELVKGSKLTAEQVKFIRSNYIPRKCSAPSLALKFGVSLALIRRIIRRSLWRHLP